MFFGKGPLSSFFSKRDIFAIRVPKNEENEFNTELINLYYDRSRMANYVLLIVSLVLFSIDLFNNGELWEQGPKYLFFIHILMILATLTLILSTRLHKSKDTGFKQVFVIIFAYLLTLVSTLISIVDQLIRGGDITVYIIGAFTIAIMTNQKPIESLRIFLINYLILAIGITLVQNNTAILRGHLVNGAILTVVACFLSIVLYNAKVRDFLSRKTIEKQKSELEMANHQLTATNQKLQDSLSALDESQNIIFTLALALESKDPYTRGHSERVAEYAVELARYLELDEVEQVVIHRAAILHDLGKIGIPDAILNNPNALTNEEWSIMKSHPARGETICSKLNFAKEILPLIRHHHERFDGSGYPDGLKGKNIPFLARIISIADTADAITSNRPYRSAGTFERVLEELKKGAGPQFDPDLVDAFISLHKSKQLNIS